MAAASSRKALTLTLAALVCGLLGQQHNLPFKYVSAGGGGSGEDYTSRSTCIGAWIIEDTDTTNADDVCSANRIDADWTNLLGDPTVSSVELPDNCPASHRSMDLDGNDGWYMPNSPFSEAFDNEEFTMGCWVRHTVDSTDTFLSFGNNENSSGYNPADSAYRGYTNTTASYSSSDETLDTWTHVVKRWDDTADEIQHFVNGVLDGTPVTKTTPPTDTGLESGLGTPKQFSSQDWAGQIHECWYIASPLDEEEICQITRCGFQDDVPDRGAGFCTLTTLSCTN